MITSCGGWRGRGAQHGPIDVRPQVFAADGAVGGAFDVKATQHRDPTAARHPLMDGWGRYLDRASKARKPAKLATSIGDSRHGFLYFHKATPNDKR